MDTHWHDEFPKVGDRVSYRNASQWFDRATVTQIKNGKFGI